MIEVSRAITIDKIEGLYSQINLDGQKQDLKIPISLESLEFGIVPALIQFVATWLRSEASGKLVVPFSRLEDQLPDFIKQDYAYPIVILAWSNGIVSEGDGQDLRPILRTYTQKINFTMRSLKGITGNQLLLTCFDHLPTPGGLLECFYDGASFIQSEDALSFTLLPTLTHVLSFNRDAFRRNLTPILEDIKGIIYELMKNTDDWARTDQDQKPLRPNIRGLYARIVKRSKDSLIEQNRLNPGFSDYYNDFTPNNELKQLYFVELSVFDSGVGFIMKFPDKPANPSISEKMSIIKRCLIKRTTAAKGTSAIGKGLGLDRILKILNGKGYLVLRTDQLLVYRNLKKDGYIPITNPDDVTLFDWTTHSSTQVTTMAPAAGSTLSIIYPLS